MRGLSGALGAALAFAAFLASLSLVVWRQSRTLEVLRALEAVRSERAVAEAERVELNRRRQMLESRSRVVKAAGERLGMRVPRGPEIVILPLDGGIGEAGGAH
ncbi:MAG TPA: cell division protein FtsL [Longimicrobiales bacterium]